MAAHPPATLERRRSGVLLAAVTALISGIAIFINGYGVRAWAEVADATTYTTLKNAGAAMILVAAALVALFRGGQGQIDRSLIRRHWLGLAVIAVIGGSIPFVLFFEGLARATSPDAAFIHKTLVVWVAILAVAFLRERVGPFHLGAILALVVGQVALTGGIQLLEMGEGEALILAATLLWAVETIVAKRVLVAVPSLVVGMARMLGGAVILVAYAVASGALSRLEAIGPEHILWIVATAGTLAAYVATWYSALARAQAIDVTAVLVAGAIVTAILDAGVRGVVPPPTLGMILVAFGALLAGVAGWRRPTLVS
jgi:drug/metabolite transporter (DMT)-like permease